jgi:hypothetical protein
MSYYIYHNWRAKRNQYTIHKSECGHCQNGEGKFENIEHGLNGVWIGPFVEMKYVEDYITKYGATKNIEKDRCI